MSRLTYSSRHHKPQRQLSDGFREVHEVPKPIEHALEAAVDIPQQQELPVLRFPLDVLPGPARRLVEEGARSLGCPPDLIGVPVLAAMGAAIGTRRCLEVKPGWEEHPAIYAAVVAKPGGCKSPAQALALAPLYAIQEDLHQKFLASLMEEQPPQSAAESESGEVVTGAGTRAKKEGQGPKVCKQEKAASKPRRRAVSQLIATDATVEALSLLLRENPHGICYAQDELTALTGGFNRYRKGLGSDREFFKSSWNCTPVVIQRVSPVKGKRELDTIRVPRPFLCIVGGIQPEMLGELSDERGREDGFPHRFLFSMPDEGPHNPSPDGVSEDTRGEYRQMIADLVSRLPVSFLADDSSVNFTDEGAAAWHSLCVDHAARMNDPSLPEHLRGPWRKLTSYAARFALVLQLGRYVCGETAGISVNETSVRDAAKLVSYFQSHAGRVYQHLRNDPADERAATLLTWITARGGAANVRHVITAHVAGCRKNGEALALFERLRRAGVGYIETQQNATGGSPSIWFRLREDESQ